MSTRTEQKDKTKKRVLLVTKKLYLDHGYIYTSTKEISSQANVSQGTVFLHFKTKESLLKKVVVKELKDLISYLEQDNITIKEVLKTFVDYEALLSRTLKDYPYLPNEFQETFDQLRAIYKDTLFELFKKTSTLDILDLFSLIDMVLALIFEDLFYRTTKTNNTKVNKYMNILSKYCK